MVKPKPFGPRLTIMGAFKVFINGDKSRHGDASLEEAVLEPIKNRGKNS